MGAVEERIHRGAGSGASSDVLRDWRPAPRDRRGVGRLPSRSALIWRSTRSRTGGAGAIETPTPGAVPDFIPVVGRYRTTATRRHSFHCGMNAADTSAYRGIRIGCVSAPRLDAVRMVVAAGAAIEGFSNVCVRFDFPARIWTQEIRG